MEDWLHPYTLTSPPKKKKNTHYSLTFFIYLHSVLNRFHLIDIITKCSQHIFHSYSLQRCYLHQPCMKNIFDHCIGSLPLCSLLTDSQISQFISYANGMPSRSSFHCGTISLVFCSLISPIPIDHFPFF
ncbi:MAG: hypothetical protein ALMCE001_01400 [Methanocorpusculum sp. MCE]|nr:MAG: hypothetical protein ALMCE001_01400 [Methanocorpusculum sp. MCE]